MRPRREEKDAHIKVNEEQDKRLYCAASEISPGIWIVDGIRYQLRRGGLYVQRPGHKSEVLSFQDALSVAEKQTDFFGLCTIT